MSEHDGGPAFPLLGVAPEDGAPIEYHGMSLRDYFAGQALAGMWTAYDAQIREATHAIMASECYAMADHMLAARSRSTDTEPERRVVEEVEEVERS